MQNGYFIIHQKVIGGLCPEQVGFGVSTFLRWFRVQIVVPQFGVGFQHPKYSAAVSCLNFSAPI